MKVVVVLAVSFFISLGICLSYSSKINWKAEYGHKYQSTSMTKPEIKMCGVCTSFAEDAIRPLLQIILDGVVGGCGALCEALAIKVNSSFAGAVCSLLCSVVGVKEFVNIINKADLDPIYYCELLKMCEINDHGDCHITSLVVTPSAVPKGSKFQIVASIVTKNGTGTGMNVFEIDAPDGLTLTAEQVAMPLQPGTYSITLDAQAEPDCNGQGPCEKWKHGNYTLIYEVCNGMCGSKHPHSQVYDTKSTVFRVTKPKN